MVRSMILLGQPQKLHIFIISVISKLSNDLRDIGKIQVLDRTLD